MQHRGVASGKNKVALFIVAVLCIASAIFTSFYIATHSSVRLDTREGRPVALLQEDEVPQQLSSLKALSSGISRLQAVRGSGQIADSGSAEQREDDLTIQHQEQRREEGTESDARKGQHDDFIVVLSVDHDKQELLQSTELLWQVCQSKCRPLIFSCSSYTIQVCISLD